jgi:DNA-binding CsgD family transcriptional regulator
VRDTLERLAPFVAYRLKGADPHAGNFVRVRDLYPDPEALSAYREYLLHPNGISDQVRLVLYHAGRMRLWAGVFRDRDFTASEVARLRCAVSGIRDAMRAVEVARFAHAGPRALELLLDSLAQPVWLLYRGIVVHANAAARELGPGSREAAARVERRGAILESGLSASRLKLGGVVVTAVVGAAPLGPRPPLPPKLARVAQAVAAGLSDKEIALHLELPLSTVRTYVQRIYSKLSVHNRASLTRVWTAANTSSRAR